MMSAQDARRGEFFQVGGTLHLDSPSYIERPADEELFRQVTSGQLCYVLTPRQMGKSSLMIRTAERLRQGGVQTAIVDLSGLGVQITREQWYLGIIKRLAQDLKLSVEPERWWRERGKLGPVQRFSDFLHDVLLAEITGRVVVFVDEIDSTLKLAFTDDFFAAIRVTYNLRASNPAYDRLTFVLLGVAAPADLIRDRRRTPFNVGRAIDLQEFSRQDAQPLRAGLERIYPGQGQAILDRVFYWTNGHPYLTQKLCQAVAASPGDGPGERADKLVEKLFLDEDAQGEDNLQFVRSNVEASPQRRRLLQLYRRVYQEKAVSADRRSLLQNRLSLIGLVRTQGDALRVRNEIYRRVFDLSWIKSNTPTNWTQRIIRGGMLISILALVLTWYIQQEQKQQERDVKLNTFTQGFRDASTANLQVYYLAGLCKIDECEQAQDLFFEQRPRQQLEMFHRVKAGASDENLVLVVDCLFPAIPERVGQPEHGRDLSRAMCCVLYRLDCDRGKQFSEEHGLDCWCEKEGCYE